jgi:hypothetical protein
VAIGWGSLIESGSSSSILQQVTLSTIDHRASTCRPWVSDAKVQFCAGVSRGGKGNYLNLRLYLSFTLYYFEYFCY